MAICLCMRYEVTVNVEYKKNCKHSFANVRAAIFICFPWKGTGKVAFLYFIKEEINTLLWMKSTLSNESIKSKPMEKSFG